MSNYVTNFELAGDFMEAFGQEVKTEPEFPDFSTRELRLELIREEYEELEEAIENRDIVGPNIEDRSGIICEDKGGNIFVIIK